MIMSLSTAGSDRPVVDPSGACIDVPSFVLWSRMNKICTGQKSQERVKGRYMPTEAAIPVRYQSPFLA